MKKLLLIIILLTTFANAQDKEPNPWEFVWGFSTSKRPFVLDSFPQTSIMTGGQWSGSTRMNNALKNNVTTAGTYSEANATVEMPLNLIIQPKWFDANYYQPGYFGAVMMQYEPTLPINSTNQGKILRPDDDSNPIFGFKNRKGTILNNPAEGNYSRLILYKDSSYINSTVLSDIWPQPRFNSYEIGEQKGQTDGYVGKKWYLAINLKRLNPNTDIIKNDDVILKIKMPYTTWDNIMGNIKFNKVPINHQDSVEELHFIDPDSASTYPYIDSRGYAHLVEVDTMTTIEITKKMIPISTDNSENITIYAEFHTNDHPNANPKFSNKEGVDEYIKDFDIEVEYLGGLDIAIDWVRVENHQGHILNRGEVDWIEPTDYNHSSGRGRDWFWPNDKDTTYTYIFESGILVDSIMNIHRHEINDIYNTIQSSLSKVKTKSNNWQDAKIFRLYFQDTEVPFFYWWGALRYVNKFSNGMFIASDVENYPELYQYYTMAPNRYFGMKFNAYEPLMSQPFFRAPYQSGFWTDKPYNLLGNKYGFSGEQPDDTLTSGYETFFTNWSRNSNDPLIFNNIKTYTDSAYVFHMRKSNSVQTEWELVIKEKFNNPINSRYLYLNSPWYVNLFIGTNLHFIKWDSTSFLNNSDSIFVVTNDVSSKTAESIRLLMNTSLLMGAKGILYDREESTPLMYLDNNGNKKYHPFTGLGDGDKPVFYNTNQKYEFIENDSLGGDFAGGYSDIYNLWDYIVPDSVAKYANITPDRIYIGTRSIRLEVKKIVDWIRLNDNELIDLRLQAMFSKGFKTFESWNPYKFSRWNSSPLRQLVNLEGIRTRKLFEPKHTMIHNTSPDYEYIDSSFFDITLLQHKNNTDTDILKNKNAVYLGVINRRTDPLIFRDSLVVGLDSLRELMFFTAAEFDDKVRYGGVDLWGINQDSTWWQGQWWKRLGSREIKIPLNIEPYGNGTYILAQEIGIDSLDSLGWRYDEKYYHRVDTTLTYKDSLLTKLLPAQGKIIKLEFVPYFFNDPTKDSDSTNDHCYFCDIFNDFDAFEFDVIETPTEEGCCYTVKFTYNGDCTFEDIPFRLIFEGESGNSFMSNNPLSPLIDSLDPNIKYKNILMDLDSAQGEVILGTFCVFESSNKYKISLLAGKDKDDKFIGCDREMQFEVKCDSTETPPIDCCEGLAVSDSMYSTGTSPLDPTLGSYCTKYNIDTGFDSDCIYGVIIEGGGVQRPLIPMGLAPIDFTFGAGFEFTLCYDIAQCGSASEQSQSIKMVKMQFLGENGTIVCEIEVPILIPCIYYGISDFDIDFTSPYIPKSSKEKPESKTYESDSFKVTVWPNPTSGELNVEIDSKVDTEVDISFISNIGASITNENGVTINKGVNEKTYNLKNYSSGVYYLQINGKDGNIVLPIMLNK